MKPESIHVSEIPSQALFRLGEWDVISVSGKDRMDYLKGVLTRAVHTVPKGGGNLHLYLSTKGRILGEILLHKQADSILLLTEPGEGASLLEFLQRYHVLEDITFSTASVGVQPYACVGEGWLHILQHAGLEAPAENQGVDCARMFESSAPVWLTRFGRLEHIPFWVCWVPQDITTMFLTVSQAHGVNLLSSEQWELLRLTGHWYHPSTLRDLLVHEAGLEHTHIDFKKGCFIGQEVVARTEHRGQANRGIYTVASAYPTPWPAQTSLQDENQKEVGHLLHHVLCHDGVSYYTSVLKHKALDEAHALFVTTPTGELQPVQLVHILP